MEYQVTSGEIDINADCTAEAHMSVKSGTLEDEGKSWIVILDGGDELWMIQTESRVAKPVVTGI